ncbi:hypothetical protein BDQ94DRAFT_62520 [Aspergillus welwitschiae]|uniref:Uncharacterized protein n=1 Tax=Aspergillus welwitschiae TaxID=1341132 RepID=A0A3F3PWD7_9EURO|nr:hypothetical protein BDQ94DRAFT_62520 [Aspergillus welwitschiae]RDH31168.1 hypothetical protein BDQ94DRAFT_62520 [Aspergillus welwitschiae]
MARKGRICHSMRTGDHLCHGFIPLKRLLPIEVEMCNYSPAFYVKQKSYFVTSLIVYSMCKQIAAMGIYSTIPALLFSL